MGESFYARCRNCGKETTVNEGGGFFFHLLHCEKCGSEKEVPFDELGDIHLAYLKGLGAPDGSASLGHDPETVEDFAGAPLSGAEYHRQVEAFVGQCPCGGAYRFNAPPRCPRCGAADLDIDEDPVCCFD